MHKLYTVDSKQDAVDSRHFTVGSEQATKRVDCQFISVHIGIRKISVAVDSTQKNINYGIPDITFEPTVEHQWLKHIWNHENMFEPGVVRANGC